MTQPRVLTAFTVLLLALAPEARAQEFPAVREIRAHTANYSARSSRPVRRFVVHTSEGSEASCIAWFRNPRARVSAHYVVSLQGRVTRMVPDMSVAYHARAYNADSIGIECEGYAGRNRWTTAQYQSLAALVRGLCDRYGIPKTRQFVIGHSEVPGSGKVDPGRFFDWSRFMALVAAGQPATTTAGAPTSGLVTVLDHAVGGGGHDDGSSLVEVLPDEVAVHGAAGGAQVGHLARGRRVVSKGGSAGWTRVLWRGRAAWVRSASVRHVPSATVEVVSAPALNVRAAPSSSAVVIGQVRRDQAFEALERRGPWILVQFDERRGWVHSDYTYAATLP